MESEIDELPLRSSRMPGQKLCALNTRGGRCLVLAFFALHFFTFNCQSSNYYFGGNEKWVTLSQKTQVPEWIDHKKADLKFRSA
ncbi:MAG: hypothetical protein ACI87E_004624 [Mariniblastus sp.]|jgi:hypothetical protein